MKINRALLLKLFWALLVALLPINALLAHEGGPQVRAEPIQEQDGMLLLTVHGINLGTDLAADVMLVGEETAVLLGAALCDGHGDFSQTFRLPASFTPGVYTIQAIDNSVSGAPRVMASVQMPLGVTSQPDISNFGAADTAVLPTPIWWAMVLLGAAVLVMVFVAWRQRQPASSLPPRHHITSSSHL